MAGGIQVEVTVNMAELEAMIVRIPRETQQVAEIWGKRCLGVSQARVPRRTGYLASTGGSGTDHSKDMAVGYTEYTAPYALTAEMGGGRRPGHHFLESSATQSAGAFVAQCAGLLV